SAPAQRRRAREAAGGPGGRGVRTGPSQDCLGAGCCLGAHVGWDSLASSPLISEAPASSWQGEIAPWAVTTIPLDVAHALNLLYSCVGKHILKPGLVVGEDLAYWTVAMRFAGGIMTRQQFLPDVVKEEGGFRARWTPVITGPDTERLRKLA